MPSTNRNYSIRKDDSPSWTTKQQKRITQAATQSLSVEYGSPQERSWEIVAKQLPACYMSNNDAEPTYQPMRKMN